MSRWGRLGRRLLFALLVLAVLGAVGVWALGRMADERLAAEIERIRAAGQPVTLVEIAPPEVPDEENAAVPLRAAFDVLREAEQAEAEAHVGGREVPWDHEDVHELLADPWQEDAARLDRLRAFVARRAEAEPLVADALARPRYRSGYDWSTGIEGQFDDVSPALDLSTYLLVRAALAARSPEPSTAFVEIERALELAPLLAQEPLLITHLLSISQVTSVLDLFESVLLRVAPPPEARQRLQSRLQALAQAPDFPRALVHERCFGSDAFRRIDQGRLGLADVVGIAEGGVPAQWVWNLVPRAVLRLDHARYLALMARAIQLAEEPYRDARGRWAAFSREARDGPWYALITPMLVLVFERAAAHEAVGSARLALAETALALEALRDADGDLPPDLSGLDLPADPCGPGPLRMRRDESGDLWLWSVGPDGQDDGGVGDPDDWIRRGDVTWQVPGRRRSG